MKDQVENVVVIGASSNPDRYSYLALNMLAEYGHKVFPVSQKESEINNIATFKSLDQITEAIDTITVYVNPKILETFKDQIVKVHPKRIIFNPGTENSALIKYFEDNGIKTVEACTLVLLRTGQF